MAALANFLVIAAIVIGLFFVYRYAAKPIWDHQVRKAVEHDQREERLRQIKAADEAEISAARAQAEKEFLAEQRAKSGPDIEDK